MNRIYAKTKKDYILLYLTSFPQPMVKVAVKNDFFLKLNKKAVEDCICQIIDKITVRTRRFFLIFFKVKPLPHISE